jgi:hypothetical protein
MFDTTEHVGIFPAQKVLARIGLYDFNRVLMACGRFLRRSMIGLRASIEHWL